jgi:hypothetical protein
MPVETGQAERGFAQLLNAAGVASIQFSSEVTLKEFEKLVRVISVGGSKAQDFASLIKNAFLDGKGNIRINTVKFIATDSSNPGAGVKPGQRHQLSPEVKWLNDPAKLVQLITAARAPRFWIVAGSALRPNVVCAGRNPGSRKYGSRHPFPLTDKETIEALRLRRFGQIGAQRSQTGAD